MDIGQGLARIFGFEPGCRRKISVHAPLRFGLELFEITRSAALRDRSGSRHEREDGSQ